MWNSYASTIMNCCSFPLSHIGLYNPTIQQRDSLLELLAPQRKSTSYLYLILVYMFFEDTNALNQVTTHHTQFGQLGLFFDAIDIW